MANPVSRSSQLIFILLQFADVATTLLAFALGGGETNALVARLMVIGTIPGLILAKIVVLAVAVVIVRLRKGRALRWANFAYTGVVVWNLTIIGRLALQNYRA